VLAPQRRGFGALTRMAEMACAGVPVLVSQHAAYALDLPPGVVAVEDEWNAWWAALERMAAGEAVTAAGDYAEWDARQPRTLEALIRAYDEGRVDVLARS
jgi:hypothetical protein